MPRVPQYNEQQVDLAPLPGVRANAPRNDLPAIGAGLAQAGASIGVIAQRRQNELNLDAVMRAESALKDSYLEFETSVRERRGQNAWGVTGEARKWWDDNARKHQNALKNDAQRRTFESSAASLRERSLAAIARHESDERARSVDEATRSSIAGSINLATHHASDPRALATTRDDVMRRVAALALQNGWTPEHHELEERDALTKLHGTVLGVLADGDPVRAQEYFDAHQDEIDGAELDNIGRLVRVGGLRARAQTESDTIVAAAKDETDALSRAAAFTGELRDEVTARVKTHFAEQRAAIEREERAAADDAWNVFARTGTVSSIPTALLDRLDGRTLQTLKNEERTRANRTSVQTNWDLYYTLRDAAVTDPARFQTLDLRQFFGELDETERRQLVNMQTEARTPSGANDVATFQQQLADMHDQLQLTGADSAEKRGRFDRVANGAVQAEMDRLGRKLTYEERQQIVDRVVIEGSLRGGGLFGLWSPSRRFYEVAGTEDEARFVPDEAPASMPKVQTDADYEALPSGTRYVAPDGSLRVKR